MTEQKTMGVRSGMLKRVCGRSSGGQGASEYALTAVLVAIACLGGLSMLGDTFAQSQENLLSDLRGNRGIASGGGEPSATGGPEVGTPGAALIADNAPGEPVPVPSQDLGPRVLATGANGATHMNASTLRGFAEQLLASGEITQSEAALLFNLANQGFRMAEMEKLLETTAARTNSLEDYRNTVVTFEGKQYTTLQLYGMLGWDNEQDPKDMTDPLNSHQALKETATFLSLYERVMDSGMLKNQAVADRVTTLSAEISFMSDLVAHANWEVYNNDLPPQETTRNMLYQLDNSKALSQQTADNSEAICREGGGNDCKG